MTQQKRPRSPALKYVYEKYIAGDPRRVASVEEERSNLAIAGKIYDLRTAAGLTESQLAALVGTSASAICRLEDADYAGQSLSMLRRIAVALDQRLEIRFVPLKRKQKTA